ncbi:hypothetical protein T4E_11978 [Trichinella pseudospiralis]|uniref:Uncharacterized protein n=1 Tax=Trichinella pseudospiralis TaxID=6337 RepID=A0A0V0XXI8_TRIPS|nr:hypothetical protein T4E_11978 [Trichinella pseudospiralis]
MGVVLISFQYLCPNAKKYMPQISACAIDTSTLLAFVRFLARLSNNPMHHCDSTRCLICLLITLNSNFLAKQQHYKKASTLVNLRLFSTCDRISIAQLPWGVVKDPITNKLGKFVSRHSLQRQAPKSAL